MSTFIEFSLLGIFSGGLYALIALSFVLIYKCTHVINFAVGEIMMLGAYLYYTSNVMLGLPPALAIVVTLAAVCLLSLTFEHVVLRPLAGQPVVSVLMATIGLASVIHGVVEALWGGDTMNVPRPVPSLTLVFGDVLVPGSVVTNFIAAVSLIGLFLLFFQYSQDGDRAACYGQRSGHGGNARHQHPLCAAAGLGARRCRRHDCRHPDLDAPRGCRRCLPPARSACSP